MTVSCDGFHDNEHRVLFLGRKFQFFSTLFRVFSKKNFYNFYREKELIRQFALILSETKPNVVNIHNLHSADLPISLVQTALKFSPVVWTLHDCWSFSGAYYPEHCSSPKHALEKQINLFWQTIKRSGLNERLSAITPSNWLKKQALASHWESTKVVSIHNPIPSFSFEPQNRQACKRALGLSDDKTIILCIAGNLSEERKGGPILKQILQSSQIENVQFLLVGKNADDSVGSPNVRNLGFVSDDITLRIAYNAADLLLHLAPIDNLPNTVAESLSCGTPVLAFDTGGLPEMVIPQKSGWIVKEINSMAMIKEIQKITTSRDFLNLRESTRNCAANLFDSEQIAQKYINHFLDAQVKSTKS